MPFAAPAQTPTVHRGRLIRFAIGLLLALGAIAAHADDRWVRAGADGRPEIRLYFFWSERCPHCLEARPYVQAIPAARPWVQLQSFELSREPDNARLYLDLAAAAGQRAESVPALVFCGEMHVGWDAGTSGTMINQRLDACRARVLAGHPPVGDTAAPLTLPILGTVDPTRLSLPVLTIAIAGLDAFNPCAFFVLLFLLSLLVHQHRRGRMLAVGTIFVLFSGMMYFAFMAAWLNLFRLIGHLAWVTLAAGVLAIAIGAINLKDFIAFGRGPTLSIPQTRKPDLYRRARAILAAGNLPSMLAATVALAIAANFYELLCTAGFPMVYTRLLTLSGLSATQHYLYLALYNAVYVLPLALIVLVFVRTLGTRRLSERQGQLLKLLSGLMMLELGALLVVAPQQLDRPWIALLLLGTAVAGTALAARLTRTDAA